MSALGRHTSLMIYFTFSCESSVDLPHEAVVSRSFDLAWVDRATAVRSKLAASSDQRSKTENSVVNSAGDVSPSQLQT